MSFHHRHPDNVARKLQINWFCRAGVVVGFCFLTPPSAAVTSAKKGKKLVGFYKARMAATKQPGNTGDDIRVLLSPAGWWSARVCRLAPKGRTQKVHSSAYAVTCQKFQAKAAAVCSTEYDEYSNRNFHSRQLTDMLAHLVLLAFGREVSLGNSLFCTNTSPINIFTVPLCQHCFAARSPRNF